MELLRKSVFALAILALALPVTAFGVQINEIRIDQSGSDTDEYFELSGNPGESLDTLYYIVIGDTGSTGTCGVIEHVTDLTPYSIQADGLFVVGETSATFFTPDATETLNFENGDNVTHMLVTGFSGMVGDDTDTNDDGTFDVTPWTGIVDSIALVGPDPPDCNGVEFPYAPTVGPDGMFVPGHVFLCTTGWVIGGFAAPGEDTPGDPNTPICDTVSVTLETWGNVKQLFR